MSSPPTCGSVGPFMARPLPLLTTCGFCGSQSSVDGVPSFFGYDAVSIGKYWRFGVACCQHLQGLSLDDHFLWDASYQSLHTRSYMTRDFVYSLVDKVPRKTDVKLITLDAVTCGDVWSGVVTWPQQVCRAVCSWMLSIKRLWTFFFNYLRLVGAISECLWTRNHHRRISSCFTTLNWHA